MAPLLRSGLLAAAATAASAAEEVRVSVDSRDAAFETEAAYASWNIDPSCNRGFHKINFTNPNLLAAAKGLHPSRLRFGGSGADYLVYGLSPGSPECAALPEEKCSFFTPGCLNATHWDNLHDFALNAGADFIFGVSWELDKACKEGAAYRWNSSAAGRLLDYIRTKGQRVWAFEFGNEINNHGRGPCHQEPESQAEGQATLGDLVRAKLPDAKLIGPDTGFDSWQSWLKGFLTKAAAFPEGKRLHAVTHHIYPGMNPRNWNSSAMLDTVLPEVRWYSSTIKSLLPDAQIWAGENGPIGAGEGDCGGNKVCGTYASSIWYADDLGLRASHGFAQHQRQTLFGGAYGLTNSASGGAGLATEEAILLRPDYWTSFLWKRVLGRKVLSAASSSKQLRAYAFSGTPPSAFAAPECAGAEMQLLLICLDASGCAASLPGGLGAVSAWTLAPMDGPFSQRASLNGKELPQLVDVSRGEPTFLGKIPVDAVSGRAGDGLHLPAASTTFACLQPGESLEISV